jgi:L-asparaginase/Glu-tRNA(Gln) amidotransferase subunit D
VSLDVKNESKVLVIYTGGTIGMVRNEQGVLAPQVMKKQVQGLVICTGGTIGMVRNEQGVLAPQVM